MKMVWTVSNVGSYHDARYEDLGRWNGVSLHVVALADLMRKIATLSEKQRRHMGAAGEEDNRVL